MTPLKRFGGPWEIASAVRYLASEKAGFITGADLLVDGGWSIRQVTRPVGLGAVDQRPVAAWQRGPAAPRLRGSAKRGPAAPWRRLSRHSDV